MADRFWVGGTGNWNDTARWSTTSGGAGGASVPTSADNTYFDGNSDSGAAFTVTLNVNANCKDFIVGDGVTVSALDQNMTLIQSNNNEWSISGGLYFPATRFTKTGGDSCRVYFVATTTGNVITTNGVSISGGVNTLTFFNGVGGGWILGSAFTLINGQGNAGLVFYQGSIDTAGYNVSANGFYSNSTLARTLLLRSSTVSLAQSSGGVDVTYMSLQNAMEWGVDTTNLTFDAGTSHIILGASSINGGSRFYSGPSALTYNKITVTTGQINFSKSLTFSGATVNEFVIQPNSLVFPIWITGPATFNTFTLEASTGLRRLGLNTDVSVGTLNLMTTNTDTRNRFNIFGVGGARTLTANTVNGGFGVDFTDITLAGAAAPFNATGVSVGDRGGNTGIVFPAPKTVYWNLAGSQNWNAVAWATTPTGTPAVANFPLAQDTAVITEAGAAGTITLNDGWGIGTLTCDNGVSPRTSGVTLNFTISGVTQVSPTYHGDIKLSSGVSLTGSNPLNITGQKVQNITSAGKTFLNPLVLNSSGGLLVLQDNLTTSSSLTLNSGTLNLNSNKTLSASIFVSSNSNARSIAFGTTGKIQLTGGGSNDLGILQMATPTNFTYTGVSNIELTYTGGAGQRRIEIGYNAVAPVLESQALNLRVLGGFDSVGFDFSSAKSGVRDLIFEDAFSGTVGFSGRFNAPVLFGSLRLSSNTASLLWAANLLFAGSNTTQNITTNGKTFSTGIIYSGTGTGSLVLQGDVALASGQSFTQNSGTVNLNGKILSTSSYASSSLNPRAIVFGAGEINLTGTGTVWDTSSSAGMVITPGTGKIRLSDTSATARGFAGGGIQSYPELVIDGPTGASTTTITGANSFSKISSTKTVASTIVFPNAVTKVGKFSAGGTSGGLLALARTGASGQFTLETTGGVQQLDYVSISNSVATPANNWFAYRSTDGGGNVGWSFTLNATAGDRYWVGGTGNWNDTTKWAIRSGGEAGSGVPTATNNAYFDGSSSIGAAFTVTLNVNASCLDFIVGDGSAVSTLSQSMVLTMSGNLTVYGSLHFPAIQFGRNGSGTLNFLATSTGKTVTTNGFALNGVNFDGAGGSWTLGSALNAVNLSVNQGTFNTGNYNITIERFYSITTTTRAVNLGSSTIVVNPDGGRWEIGGTIANLAFNSGTSKLVINRSGGSTCQFFGGNQTYYDVELNTQGTKEIYGNNTFRNIVIRVDNNQGVTFDFKGSNTIAQITSSGVTYFSVLLLRAVNNIASIVLGTNWRLSTEAAQTIGTLTIGPGSATGTRICMLLGGNLTVGTLSLQEANTNRLTRASVISNLVGTARVITATTVNIGDGVDIQDVTAAGTSAPWNLSARSVGDLKGNSNITFPAPKTVYWNLAGGQNWESTAWATTPTGIPAAANFPLAQDTAVITEFGAAGIISLYSNWNIGTLEFDNAISPRTSPVTLQVSAGPGVFGDLKLSSGVTITGLATLVMQKRGTQSIKSVGKVFTAGVFLDSPGGTLVLDGDLTLDPSRTFTVNRGTLNLNGNVLNTGIFVSANANVRSIAFGDSKIQISGSNALVLNLNNLINFSYTGISNFEFTYTGSAGTRISSCGAGEVTQAQVVNINILGGSDSFSFGTQNSKSRYNNVIFSDAFTGKLEYPGSNHHMPDIYGDLRLSTNTSGYSRVQNTVLVVDFGFVGTAAVQRVINWPTLLYPYPVFFAKSSGLVRLESNISTSNFVIFDSGELDLNGKILTASSFSSSNTNIRTLKFGAGQIILTDTGTVWLASTATNFTVVPGTGKIVLSNNTNTARLFEGGGILTYPELEFGGDTGTATTTITGSNGFAKLTNTKLVAYTIVFPNSETRVSNWNLNGSENNLITLSRTGASGSFTIRSIAGSASLGRYLNISNSNGVPANRMHAIYSVDGGGNTGWTFGPPNVGRFLSFFEI